MTKIAAFLLCVFSWSFAMAADFSTPQSALRALEAAYAHNDLNAAVAAKNFRIEAVELLRSHNSAYAADSELVRKTAKVLELSFREQMRTQGFPDFNHVTCRILSTKYLRTDVAEMTEVCTFSDGGTSETVIHAAKEGNKWGVVVLPQDQY